MMKKIEKLLKSPNKEDVIIGIELAYNNLHEDEFIDLMEDRKTNLPYHRDTPYLFKAYNKIYVLHGEYLYIDKALPTEIVNDLDNNIIYEEKDNEIT